MPSDQKPIKRLPCVLACSGCSRAGELAHLTARRLEKLGAANMSRLAGVGGRVKSILNTIQCAPELLMIDGCPLECGGNSLKLAGIARFQHLKLYEHGIRKYASEVNEKTVSRLAEVAAKRLSRSPDGPSEEMVRRIEQLVK